MLKSGFSQACVATANGDLIVNMKDSLFKRVGYGTINQSYYSLHCLTNGSRQPVWYSPYYGVHALYSNQDICHAFAVVRHAILLSHLVRRYMTSRVVYQTSTVFSSWCFQLVSSLSSIGFLEILHLSFLYNHNFCHIFLQQAVHCRCVHVGRLVYITFSRPPQKCMHLLSLCSLLKFDSYFIMLMCLLFLICITRHISWYDNLYQLYIYIFIYIQNNVFSSSAK